MPVTVTLRPTTRGALRVYPIDFARSLGVDAFVTDRFGGVSRAPYDTLNLALHVGDDPEHVNENRRRVAHACGVRPENLRTVHQVHGTAIVNAARALDTTHADGLISSSTETALAILVADCVPVLLIDASSSRICVVHAGWRGLAAGVLRSALGHFDTARSVHAFVGPSISQQHYQVGPDVAAHFVDIPGALVEDGGDRSRLDLRRVTAFQLNASGLLDEQIVISQQTTEGGTPFFSDRQRRPCGRFALVAKRAS